MTRQEQPLITLSEIMLIRDTRMIMGPLSLSINAGKSVAIIGPNGSGKSSLLKIMAGLTRPTSGNCHVGADINYVGHVLPLDPRLTSQQNIAFLGAGVDPYGNVPVLCLSQGQQKKLFLSYFTSQHQKKIWLLDEPFTHLDASSINLLIAEIKTHQECGGCVVLTHHGELPMQVDDVVMLQHLPNYLQSPHRP